MIEINKQEFLDKVTTLGKSIGLFAFIYIIASLITAIFSEIIFSGDGSIFSTIAVQATIFISLWYVILSKYHPEIIDKVYQNAVLNIQTIKSASLSATAILIIYSILSVFIYVFSNDIREHDSPLVDATMSDPVSLAIGILFMFTFVAISEELVFRAGVYEILKKSYSVKTSAALSAAIFGLPHITVLTLDITSMVTILATGFAGFIFALLYERTDNIVAPIIAHGVYNTLLLLIVYFG